MGTLGRSFEHRCERDRDLLDTYKKNIKEVGYPFSLMDVVTKTVNSPSKRFWVSPERAFRVILEMEAGEDLSRMIGNKRKMYLEIHKRVRALRRQARYKNESLATLVSIVVEQPAPCFYMTPKSAIVIMHKIRKCRKGSIK